MNGIAIMAIALVALIAGYILYGKWLERKWGVDNNRKTPAVEINDGIDYVPTKYSDGYLFFSGALSEASSSEQSRTFPQCTHP